MLCCECNDIIESGHDWKVGVEETIEVEGFHELEAGSQESSLLSPDPVVCRAVILRPYTYTRVGVVSYLGISTSLTPSMPLRATNTVSCWIYC